MSIVNWLVRDSSSFLTSLRVIVNHTPSARVIIVFENYLYHLYLMIKSNKVGEEQELQSTESLERKDRILGELIQLICICQEVQRAAELHKRQRPQ